MSAVEFRDGFTDLTVWLDPSSRRAHLDMCRMGDALGSLTLNPAQAADLIRALTPLAQVRIPVDFPVEDGAADRAHDARVDAMRGVL